MSRILVLVLSLTWVFIAGNHNSFAVDPSHGREEFEYGFVWVRYEKPACELYLDSFGSIKDEYEKNRKIVFWCIQATDLELLRLHPIFSFTYYHGERPFEELIKNKDYKVISNIDEAIGNLIEELKLESQKYQSVFDELARDFSCIEGAAQFGAAKDEITSQMRKRNRSIELSPKISDMKHVHSLKALETIEIDYKIDEFSRPFHGQIEQGSWQEFQNGGGLVLRIPYQDVVNDLKINQRRFVKKMIIQGNIPADGLIFSRAGEHTAEFVDTDGDILITAYGQSGQIKVEIPEQAIEYKVPMYIQPPTVSPSDDQ